MSTQDASHQRLVDGLLVEDRPLDCQRANNLLIPLRWTDALVRLLLGTPSLVEKVARVTSATDLRWISGYVSIRPPNTDALEWHRDWWCWDHPVSFTRAAVQVAVLCYLDDANDQNGALRIVPGSHRHGTNDAREMTLPVHAGDVVVLDYRLLHGTTANLMSQRRDCVLLSFTPRWHALPEDLRGHLIQHLALPRIDESVPASCSHANLLPYFDGRRADLDLNWHPPADFEID